MWFFWDFCKLLTQTIIHILFNYKLIEFIHPSVIRFSDFDWVKLGLKMGTIMLCVCTSVRGRHSAPNSTVHLVEYVKLWR